MKAFIAAVLCALLLASGCITLAGGALERITPAAPDSRATIEQTVGDFSFTLEGGKMVTSNKMGRSLNDELLTRWKKKGYIQDYEYVKSGRFTGKADYNLTLSGSQYGESSIAAQILSGLTLLIIPYTVNTKYDIEYTLEDVRTGRRYSAHAEDSFRSVTELLLFLAFPFSLRGFNATMDVLSDHLYAGLRAQGAFATEPPAEAGASPVAQPAPVPF